MTTLSVSNVIPLERRAAAIVNVGEGHVLSEHPHFFNADMTADEVEVTVGGLHDHQFYVVGDWSAEDYTPDGSEFVDHGASLRAGRACD